MRTLLANALNRAARWLVPKAIPPALTGGQWSGTQFVDAYRRNRAPTPNELMAELKNTAWACASINAAVCASNPPQLYVATQEGQPAARAIGVQPAGHMHVLLEVTLQRDVDERRARCGQLHAG